MSESSWEENKQKNHEAHELALHARYHLVHMCGSYHRIVTEASSNECVHYRYVVGLEWVLLGEAIEIARSLNRGDTTEEDYGRKTR